MPCVKSCCFVHTSLVSGHDRLMTKNEDWTSESLALEISSRTKPAHRIAVHPVGSAIGEAYSLLYRRARQAHCFYLDEVILALPFDFHSIARQVLQLRRQRLESVHALIIRVQFLIHQLKLTSKRNKKTTFKPAEVRDDLGPFMVFVPCTPVSSRRKVPRRGDVRQSLVWYSRTLLNFSDKNNNSTAIFQILSQTSDLGLFLQDCIVTMKTLKMCCFKLALETDIHSKQKRKR